MPERKDVTTLALDMLYDHGDYTDSHVYTEDIAADLRQRSKEGVLQYGTPLQSHNGRDALMDLYEEMLDAYLYAVQFEEEFDRIEHPGGIAKIVLETLKLVAAEVDTYDEDKGFLRGRQPDPIGADDRRQIEEYAGYIDVYKTYTTED